MRTLQSGDGKVSRLTPGDIPDVPPADHPMWGGEDDTLGQVERQLCLASQLAAQGGTQEELEEAP